MMATSTGSLAAALTPSRGVVALVVLTWAAYLGVLDNDFVGFDDPQLVTGNEMIRRGLSIAGLKAAWAVPIVGNWTPLAWASHMLDMELFGTWAGGHHITSVLIHTFASSVLFLAWHQQRSMTESFFLALVFAIHPVHVESVAWISERRDVLSMAFFALLLLVWLNDRLRSTAAGRVLALGLLIAALWSKSTMVTVPAVLVLLDVFLLRRLQDTSLVTLVVEKLPMLVSVAIVASFTALAQEVSQIDSENIGFRLVGALVAYGHYVGSFIAPHNLAALYARPKVWSTNEVVGAGVVVGLALAMAVWRFQRTRNQLIPLGVFWFGGTLIPMIGLVQVGAQAYADRYLYLPSLGLFLFLWGLAESVRANTRDAIVVIWCLVLTVVTSRQVEAWEDNDALWRNCLDAGHDNRFALQWSGHQAVKRGEYQLALRDYRRALVFMDNAQLAVDIGYAEYRSGKADKGRSSFVAAIDREVGNPVPHYWLGRINEEEHNYAFAAAAYQVALGLGTDDPSAWLGLGRASIHLGRRSAVDRVEAALLRRRDDDSPAVAGFALAALAWEDGRPADAAARVDQAIARVPRLVDALALRTAFSLGAPGLPLENETATRFLERLVEVEGYGPRWVVLARLKGLLAEPVEGRDPWADGDLPPTYRDEKWKSLAARMKSADVDGRREQAAAWLDEVIELVFADALEEFEPTGMVESVHL